MAAQLVVSNSKNCATDPLSTLCGGCTYTYCSMSIICRLFSFQFFFFFSRILLIPILRTQLHTNTYISDGNAVKCSWNYHKKWSQPHYTSASTCGPWCIYENKCALKLIHTLPPDTPLLRGEPLSYRSATTTFWLLHLTLFTRPGRTIHSIIQHKTYQ